MKLEYFNLLVDLIAGQSFFYESFKSGPVNGENSGNSDGSVEFSGSYRKKSFVLTPSITFKKSRYSFYGNADRINSGFDSGNPDDVSLNNFQFDVSLASDSNDLSYSIKPFIAHVSQKNTSASGLNMETVFGTSASLGYKIDDSFTTGFYLEGQSSSYDGGITYDRSLTNINPWLTHKRENLAITAGFMISSGKMISESKTGFYPRARIEYSFTDKWSIYGLLSGGWVWNGLIQLLDQNKFLDDSLSITQLEYTSQFGSGIKGVPFKNVLLEAGLTYSSVNELPFFDPSSSDSSRYSILYDSESVDVVTLQSNLTFIPTATGIYGINLEINGYSVKSLDRPWHKPTYIFKVYTSHNIQEKLIFSAYMTSMGGIRAPVNVDFSYIKLPTIADLGVSAEYLITSRVFVFIDINNLLNNEYEQYLGYPARGITFKIGGQCRF